MEGESLVLSLARGKDSFPDPWEGVTSPGNLPLELAAGLDVAGKAVLRELLAGWGRSLLPGCLAETRVEGRSRPYRFPPDPPVGHHPGTRAAAEKSAGTEREQNTGKMRSEEWP